MKKLLLIVGFLSCSCFGAETIVPTYSVTTPEISNFFCSKSNVFILQNCVSEFNKCIDGYMSTRINIREGVKLLSAMTFCANSLNDI